jgi:metal-sulfur cluster biosynthetic enzyme
LLREPDVERVTIREVWDPPWTVERLTPEGREALRRVGVAA